MRKLKPLVAPLLVCAAFTFVPLTDSLTNYAYSQNLVYSPSTRPFSPSSRITSIAQTILPSCNQTRSCLLALHLSLRPLFQPRSSVSLSNPPLTASDALIFSSDCSDQVNATISTVAEINRLNPSLNLRGVVKIIHFENSPPNVFHAYLEINFGSRRIIFDPSSRTFGSLAFRGRFSVLRTLTFDQFEYLFHKEWGDYFLSRNEYLRAVSAYERSLEFYSLDPNLHLNLASAYSNLGRSTDASMHLNIYRSLSH